jgi:hypothetical protein
MTRPTVTKRAAAATSEKVRGLGHPEFSCEGVPTSWGPSDERSLVRLDPVNRNRTRAAQSDALCHVWSLDVVEAQRRKL